MWELASEMRRKFDYDMYLDPSHMAGVRSLVKTTITDAYTEAMTDYSLSRTTTHQRHYATRTNN